MDSTFDVLIIGAGFSGTVLAADLAAHSPTLRIALIDKSAVGQAGVAYSTVCDRHLLNVPAGNMSAFVREPADFIDWARSNDVELDSKAFAQRSLYRRYLADLQLRIQAHGRVTVIRAEAVALHESAGKWVCQLADSRYLSADSAVLAFGNFLPAPMPEFAKLEGSDSYIADPWAPIEGPQWGSCQHVGTAGSGLTAIDVVLGLESAGFRGHYTLFSRHGLLPYTHRQNMKPIDPDLVPAPNSSLRRLLREFRQCAEAAEADGSDWRTLIDAIRPIISTYWRTLSPRDQQRFLSHVRTYWDVHRHRVAPGVADQIHEIADQGRLEVVAGTLMPARLCGQSIELPVRLKGSHIVRDFRLDALFNCTGSPIRASSWPSPLLKSLIKNRVCAWNQTEMGLQCEDDGRVLDASQQPHGGLYVLGLLRRGLLWESTAVPDLRTQAAKLSELIKGT